MHQHQVDVSSPTDADLAARQAEVHAGAIAVVLAGIEDKCVRLAERRQLGGRRADEHVVHEQCVVGARSHDAHLEPCLRGASEQCAPLFHDILHIPVLLMLLDAHYESRSTRTLRGLHGPTEQLAVLIVSQHRARAHQSPVWCCECLACYATVSMQELFNTTVASTHSKSKDASLIPDCLHNSMDTAQQCQQLIQATPKAYRQQDADMLHVARDEHGPVRRPICHIQTLGHTVGSQFA